MPLADTSAALDSDITSIRTGLQNALAAGHDVLDNLVSQLDQHAADVRAVAAIADSPIVAAAAGALHVPAPILDGITMMLNAVAAEHAKPAEEAPAEPAPPAAEVPAEQQPEPAAA